MNIKSIELKNYRNYKDSTIYFDKGTNILYGNNAQGKTNVLEAIFLCATSKSHRASRDKEIIYFGEEEARVSLSFEKSEEEINIDILVRNNKSKIAYVNESKIKRATDLLGILNVVLFSPEDLSIIKSGPSERRRFVDIELCQIDKIYLYNLSKYNKALDQRNKLIKDIGNDSKLIDTLDVWDEQLFIYGQEIIKRRREFVNKLNEIIFEIHKKLTNEKENIEIIYEPNTDEKSLKLSLKKNQIKDIKNKNTSVGPQRDDVSFLINGIDIRKYGSQGQQRTAALSLKLSEIEIIKLKTGHTPVLLLDDVLSELDSERQNYLLNTIGDIQTIITCTGLDDFVNNNFKINKLIRVKKGTIIDS